MKGCRSFTDEEAVLIMGAFAGPFSGRDRAIFTLGRYTGERISAILRLKVADVVQGGQVSDAVTYRRANRKGKVEGRTIKLHPEAKFILSSWIAQLSHNRTLEPTEYIFKSRKGDLPITRIQYHRILKCAVNDLQLRGKIATHSMRKTFADRIYENLGHDLFRTQKALGHKNINSTVQYLSFREADIEAAIMAL